MFNGLHKILHCQEFGLYLDKYLESNLLLQLLLDLIYTMQEVFLVIT